MSQAAEPIAFDRGMAAFRKRDFVAAEREFRQLTIQDPDSARAWKLLGMTYSAQEKYALAVGPYSRACQLDSAEENACYYLGRVYFATSRFAKALEAFGKAPKNGRVLAGEALAFEAIGKPVEAEALYKQAIAAGERQAALD